MKRARGRPRGFDPEAALDAALETFWRKGFRNTSMDDLVAAMGASRASVYELFGDKR
ncbi:MAG: helix-turn-helix domain-containing protein, partial [Pseudomonadota bacterium]